MSVGPAVPTARIDHAAPVDPRRWKALAVCLIAMFMTFLDDSIVIVALPSIREGLSASDSALQWIVSGYALSFGLVLVPAGRLGDAWGRRTIFGYGLTLFILTSVAAGMAGSATSLTVARFAQGVASGILLPQVSALIQQLFRSAERGKAFGLFSATVGLASAAGPLAGGVIIGLIGVHSGWRWIFYINVPIGLVALVLSWRWIPRKRAERTSIRALDPIGVALLGLAVLAFLLPFEERSWDAATQWASIAGAVLLGVLFICWERWYEQRGGRPVLTLTLFRLRSFSLGNAIGLLYFCGFTSLFFVVTLYLQSGLGFSAIATGAVMTSFAIGYAATSVFSGRLAARLGGWVIVLGACVVLVGLGTVVVLVTLLPTASGAVWATFPLLIAGIGSGMIIAPNQTTTLDDVPLEYAGSAGGMLQTGRRIGAAIGIATAGSALFATLGSHGQWAQGFRASLFVVLGFVVVALLLALFDVLSRRPRAVS
jgi:EmrB/QacA subfamily drug resistance transporter